MQVRFVDKESGPQCSLEQAPTIVGRRDGVKGFEMRVRVAGKGSGPSALSDTTH